MTNRLKGYGALLSSAFCFYFATYFLHVAEKIDAGNALFFVFARLFLGLIVVSSLIAFSADAPFFPKNRFWVLSRAFWNTVALCFFYVSVTYGSVTEANIFNMTYPAFVALLAPVLIKEKNNPSQWAAVCLTLFGVFLIFGFPSMQISFLGNLLGVLSGVTAAIAILSLRKARGFDHWLTILFANFSFGSLCLGLYLFFSGPFEFPEKVTGWLFLSAASGILGQFGLTFGFRYVSAIEGSILSSTRILISLIATVWLGVTGLSMFAGLGAFLIFCANALAVQRK